MEKKVDYKLTFIFTMAYFINNYNQKIAYNYIKGRAPGIIFIHGLNSDMQGKKALSIQKYARKKGLSFLRFDCRGHGKSYGRFHEFSVEDWKNDLKLNQNRNNELEKIYEEMINNQSTELLGLRGLMKQFLYAQDYHHAFIYGEKLFLKNHNIDKLYDTLINIIGKTNNWQKLLEINDRALKNKFCLLYTSPSPRDRG